MTVLRSPAGTADEAAEAAARRQRPALAALLAGAVGIAFAPIFVRLSELGPVATAFWRLALALPVLWLWQAAAARAAPLTARPQSRGETIGLIIAGLCFAGDLAVWHWSLRFTSVANATLLPNFAPVFVTLGGFLLFGERFTRRFLLGMLVALAGAAILMGHSVSLSLANLFGDALGLITAVFYAGYILAVGRLRTRLATATIMAWSGTVTCGALLILAAVTEDRLLPTSADGLAVLLGLALVSHAAGQSLIAYALAHLPAAFSAVSLLLQPAVAALLAWVLLNEPLGPLQGLGALVILAGIALARLGSR
ncbi:MAG: DMT family transporter [Rhodospirillales bacterium]|jgi:drug/metabolite transporter (DMT)-like permease|nr:DMT family transporter [Rhodospirillales bacterium]